MPTNVNNKKPPARHDSRWTDDGADYDEEADQRSTGLSSSGGSHTGGSASEEDTPAALVKTEDKAVSILRIVAIVLLLAAACATASMVYVFASGAEEESFHRSFDEIAVRIIDSFLEETGKKFWHARSLAAGINGFMALGNLSKIDLSVPTWEAMTEEARILSGAHVVSWSPFLFNQDELSAFEDHTIAETDGGIPVPGPNPPCYICGSEELVLTNPDTNVELGGVGFFPCADLFGAGRSGSVSRCQLVLDATEGNCLCGPPPDDITVIPPRTTAQGIWMIGPDGLAVDDTTSAPWAPMWQLASRGGSEATFLYNQMTEPPRQRALNGMINHKVPSFSEFFRRQGKYYENYVKGKVDELVAVLVYPVFGFDSDELAGSIVMENFWSEFLPSTFPIDSHLVDIVISNTCGQNYTFRVDEEAKELALVGEGDLHDPTFDGLVQSSDFVQYDDVVRFASANPPETEDLVHFCRYRFLVYPTQALEDDHITNQPIIFTVVVATIFLFTTAVFFLYDFFVRRRQRMVMERATRTGAIVSSLFPENVRERLYHADALKSTTRASAISKAPKDHIKNFLNTKGADMLNSEPIADLFPHTTIMFIDICGFTAWSSERDPSQVFRLLEAIYQTFDEIAKRRNIFKVETIGDSYVAASGLPEPRDDHATVMVRFAHECLREMSHLVKRLEVLLGPSTGDLKARCGVHSGSVTAGVLRGAKARFQLFGDTMNVCARLESTGKEGRIHISKDTAALLKVAGKSNWVSPRKDVVVVKGKGEIQTYWANPKAQSGPRATMTTFQSDTQSEGGNSAGFADYSATSEEVMLQTDEKVQRLIDWNVQALYNLLEEVVKKRRAVSRPSSPASVHLAEKRITQKPGIVFDEISEVVSVPIFDKTVVGNEQIMLDMKVRKELTAFVSRLSGQYHGVPFHNFEHASHVTMSAGKLMKRIIVPDGIDYDQEDADVAKDVHEVTYGISSDPLMQFAIVFAALIHDVDHTGLPNAELVRMQTPAALAYQGRSVAEQNSVDMAWNTLMSPEFESLRYCIYSTPEELQRFRQLVVNAVLATDIADKELQALRRDRWARAFNAEGIIPEKLANAAVTADGFHSVHNIDRRATIVFEYIIQASDVAHTMQHWHTYQKWNERLFFERYKAYLDGHEEEDPSIGWYKGEIGFFDFYIIPLAKKLKECGVFGVSHHEYLAYAQGNRIEWESKGHEIVKKMHEAAVRKFGMGPSSPSKTNVPASNAY